MLNLIKYCDKDDENIDLSIIFPSQILLAHKAFKHIYIHLITNILYVVGINIYNFVTVFTLMSISTGLRVPMIIGHFLRDNILRQVTGLVVTGYIYPD